MANTFLNSKLDLTTTNATTLYTCPSNARAIVKSIYVNDDSGSGSTINLVVFAGDPASAASFTIFNAKAISANVTEQLITEPLILMENEVIQVTAGNADRLNVIASILEISRPDQNG